MNMIGTKNIHTKLYINGGNSCEYGSKHLMKAHMLVDSIERREACQSVKCRKITKMNLVYQIINLIFKKANFADIFKIQRDVKQFIETGKNMTCDAVLKGFV